MLQLLCQIDAADPAAWREMFDDDAENRAQAGLTLLQMWSDADTPSHVVLLFQVNDRGRAQAWLDRSAGFGRPVAAHFLKTA
ncbi:hypothetical protein [Frigidibacter oleivorans]|uniref:hypothetical protein n=1 Tax=Frigidibacter oleivorans TaxID=2487129 RepID=UPI000F8CEBAD|nr:hypothetical protein [Frigidibacter oleivorans]